MQEENKSIIDIIQENREKEKKRFDNAMKYKLSECPIEKIEQAVYYGNDFGCMTCYPSLRNMILDYVQHHEEKYIPRYVYGSKSKKIKIRLSARSMLEHNISDMIEDYIFNVSFKEEEKINELQNILNDWNKNNQELEICRPDFDCVILLEN